MLLANVAAFLATQLFAVALLGGYARERDTHPTATTDALEQLGLYVAIAALIFAIACYFMSSRTSARNAALLTLALAWPILIALTVITLETEL